MLTLDDFFYVNFDRFGLLLQNWMNLFRRVFSGHVLVKCTKLHAWIVNVDKFRIDLKNGINSELIWIMLLLELTSCWLLMRYLFLPPMKNKEIFSKQKQFKSNNRQQHNSRSDVLTQYWVPFIQRKKNGASIRGYPIFSAWDVLFRCCLLLKKYSILGTESELSCHVDQS